VSYSNTAPDGEYSAFQIVNANGKFTLQNLHEPKSIHTIQLTV